MRIVARDMGAQTTLGMEMLRREGVVLGNLMGEIGDRFHSHKVIGKPHNALLLMMLFTAIVQ